jgi:hypothetical protein
VCGSGGRLRLLAREGSRRLGRLGRVLGAARGTHRGLVGHVEGVEGALQIFVVVILLGLAVLHGEQRLWQEEFLHVAPCSVCLVDALEVDAFGGFVGRDLVEPLDGFARVCVDALGAVLEALELVEGWYKVSMGTKIAAIRCLLCSGT